MIFFVVRWGGVRRGGDGVDENTTRVQARVGEMRKLKKWLMHWGVHLVERGGGMGVGRIIPG